MGAVAWCFSKEEYERCLARGMEAVLATPEQIQAAKEAEVCNNASLPPHYKGLGIDYAMVQRAFGPMSYDSLRLLLDLHARLVRPEQPVVKIGMAQKIIKGMPLDAQLDELRARGFTVSKVSDDCAVTVSISKPQPVDVQNCAAGIPVPLVSILKNTKLF